MRLTNCLTKKEKELLAISLDELNPVEKGLLAIDIRNTFHLGELQDTEIVVGALEQIVLSLIPIPSDPVDIIQGKSILKAYPIPDGQEVVLALFGREYVTWKYNRNNNEFNHGHYFYWAHYRSQVEAYLAAHHDFNERIRYETEVTYEGI